MARRRAVTREQLGELLALPVAEPELIRHWTLSAGDLAAIERRRRDPNQLGFALQLCAFRYPGACCARARSFRKRLSPSLPTNCALLLMRSPITPCATKPDASSCATCGQHSVPACLARTQARVASMAVPVALGNTDAVATAATLMDELRRRKIIAPGASVIERLVASAATLAERQVANQLTEAASRPGQGAGCSVDDQGGHLAERSRLGTSAARRARPPRPCASGGAARPAQHDRHQSRLCRRRSSRTAAQACTRRCPLHRAASAGAVAAGRRATLVATVLDTITRLTDDTVALFDRAVGRMSAAQKSAHKMH